MPAVHVQLLVCNYALVIRRLQVGASIYIYSSICTPHLLEISTIVTPLLRTMVHIAFVSRGFGMLFGGDVSGPTHLVANTTHYSSS